MVNDSLNEQRVEKIEKLKEAGMQAFAMGFSRSHTCAELLAGWEPLATDETKVTTAGRLKALREMGKASFGDIHDDSGRVQVYFKQNHIGEEKFKLLKLIDIGDIIGVTGQVFKTKTGEITIYVEDFKLLTKSLRELPEKWHGLSNVEIRYRQRYVDLISNPEVKDCFKKRSLIIRHIRDFLHSRDFMEVETPMMQSIAGGAIARPFVTHHNALDIDLFLRIAPELYLKRLIVGGYERIFEINRNFRNEGISTKHNPEFTTLELYQAYADYQDMMNITELMISEAAKSIHDAYTCEFEAHTLNFEPPWPRFKWLEQMQKFIHPDITTDMPKDTLLKICEEKNVKIDTKLNNGKILDKLFGLFVEPNLVQPCFMYDYPTEISPLARRREDDPTLTERFEGFAAGMEIANAFTELTDPIDQLGRFTSQQELRDAGDAEAHVVDMDFIRALQFGMPPTGGLGIGIDRIVMLLTNSPSIRDVIFFPTLRPEV